LYAAALQKMRPDEIVARMEYRTFRDPKAVHQLNLVPLKTGKIHDAPEAQAKLDNALNAVAARIRDARSGSLPASPVKSCGCSPYCPARDVCRVPGGPEDLF
jgi:hypothetical protein